MPWDKLNMLPKEHETIVCLIQRALDNLMPYLQSMGQPYLLHKGHGTFDNLMCYTNRMEQLSVCLIQTARENLKSCNKSMGQPYVSSKCMGQPYIYMPYTKSMRQSYYVYKEHGTTILFIQRAWDNHMSHTKSMGQPVLSKVLGTILYLKEYWTTLCLAQRA